jgi:hypothetical protein
MFSLIESTLREDCKEKAFSVELYDIMELKPIEVHLSIPLEDYFIKEDFFCKIINKRVL